MGRTAFALRSALALIGIGAITAMGWMANSAAPYDEPTALELELALRQTGLTPEVLAAAGVTEGEVDNVIDAMRSYLTDHGGQLQLVQSQRAAAKTESQSLMRLVQSGLASDQEINERQLAQVTYDGLVTQHDQMLDTAFDEATQPLSASVRDALATIRGNADWSRLGEPYGVVNRTQAEWVQLRGALAHERIVTERGEPVDPEIATFLASVRTAPDVALAQAALDLNLSAVEAAWATEVGTIFP